MNEKRVGFLFSLSLVTCAQEAIKGKSIPPPLSADLDRHTTNFSVRGSCEIGEIESIEGDMRLSACPANGRARRRDSDYSCPSPLRDVGTRESDRLGEEERRRDLALDESGVGERTGVGVPGDWRSTGR